MRSWLALSALVVALDLYTKSLVLQHFIPGEHLYVSAFFDLVRYHNEGAAFSLLADAGGWQRVFFSGIAIVVALVILRLLRRHAGESLFCLALALVLGGALGNLYDRLTLGYVVDFLFFHYRSWYWPAFNVADAAISCGIVLLLVDGLRKPRAQRA